MAVSLASTKNIPIADAKKIAISPFSYPASFTDPRCDFQNFPNIPNR